MVNPGEAELPQRVQELSDRSEAFSQVFATMNAARAEMRMRNLQIDADKLAGFEMGVVDNVGLWGNWFSFARQELMREQDTLTDVDIHDRAMRYHTGEIGAISVQSVQAETYQASKAGFLSYGAQDILLRAFGCLAEGASLDNARDLPLEAEEGKPWQSVLDTQSKTDGKGTYRADFHYPTNIRGVTMNLGYQQMKGDKEEIFRWVSLSFSKDRVIELIPKMVP